MKRVAYFFILLMLVLTACDITITVPTSPAPLPTNTILPATTEPTQVLDPATPTPEIFISLTQAIPAEVKLNETTLVVAEARFEACNIPNCPPAPAGTRYLLVPLQALNLSPDTSLPYKQLPDGIAIHDNTGMTTPFNRVLTYSQPTQQLALYFAVPQAATTFGLQWPGSAEIPLAISAGPVPTQPLADIVASVYVVHLTLPEGLASGLRGIDVPGVNGQDLPYWELTPGHTFSKLEGYVLQGTLHEPKIYVFPAQKYAEMVPAAFESIHRLNNILYDPNTAADVDLLPAVPFFNAAQVFASNVQTLAFQNGRGIRFVTEYAQYAAPVNNHELFYQYQGLTSDGAYYIVAILPIRMPALADTDDPNAVLPSGGIPYPNLDDPNADFPGYYAEVTTLLNETTSEIFTPNLSQLDQLIQSIEIAP
jgi:hypothetical protein